MSHPTTPDPQVDGKTAMKAATGRGTLLGAIFLMATSSIGPGFITQTTSFTVQLGAAFAFAIVISILVDIAIQTNVWRVIGISGMRAQELGNATLPGLGYLMAFLLLAGGLVFNIGNISGAGLGMNIMTDMNIQLGAIILSALAVAIFLSKRAGVAMDRIVVVLGAVMILLTLYVAITSGPPVGEALRQSVLPDEISALAITTLVGGTIGGYIIYAGVHRLLDAGVSGPAYLSQLTQGAVTGILVTGVMRVILFLAILGVVSAGHALDPERQAASAFEAAAGAVGYRLFGVVFAAAALTSVIGVSYTTVTFLTSRTKTKPPGDQLHGHRLHRRVPRPLPVDRCGPRPVARLRRRLQWDPAAGRDRGHALGRLASTGPAAGLRVPQMARRHRYRCLGVDHLPGDQLRPPGHRAADGVSMGEAMRILPSGSRGLLLELDTLDDVLRQYAALLDADLPVLDLVPAGRTILVIADRETDLGDLRAEVEQVHPAERGQQEGSTVEVPVRYDGEDLAEAAELLGCSPEELVARHQEEDWTVAFCGFAPGFGYLAGSRFDWDTPRRSSPRTKVPAGALALAGEFTGVYPRESPGGWQLIGTALVDIFDLDRDPPALLVPGAAVRFVEQS